MALPERWPHITQVMLDNPSVVSLYLRARGPEFDSFTWEVTQGERMAGCLLLAAQAECNGWRQLAPQGWERQSKACYVRRLHGWLAYLSGESHGPPEVHPAPPMPQARGNLPLLLPSRQPGED